MRERATIDLSPSPFSRTAPLDVIETENRRGEPVRILPVRDMQAHFEAAKDVIAEIEENVRFGRTTRGMGAALYPALEGLLDGVATWCTLKNIEAYAERLPEIHPNVNTDATTLHRIILGQGTMHDEMFGDDAPFPNIMGFPKSHRPFDNLIVPLKDAGALDITTRQARAMGASMQGLLDLSYIARGSINHHGFKLGSKFIQTWKDVDESTFTDFVVPAMRGIASTTASAVKRNRDLAIPRAWLPRVETTPIEIPDPTDALVHEFAELLKKPGTDAVKGVSTLLDALTSNRTERDEILLQLMDTDVEDRDGPDF